MTELKIIIVAGPNGAGKTTFAREFLPQEAGCPVFVNADLIAGDGSKPASDSSPRYTSRSWINGFFMTTQVMSPP